MASVATQSLPSHSASPSLQGYLYQCRYALLAALREGRRNPGLLISIEKYDDVAFEVDGTPYALIQTKHHVSRRGNLSDASVDLWKTIKVWIDATSKDSSLLHNSKFFLLTSGVATPGSAASFLKESNRDPNRAIRLLQNAAGKSTNNSNTLAYMSFLGMDSGQRRELLDAVTVLDGAPQMSSLESELKIELQLSTPHDFLDQMLLQLEGWWFRTVIDVLTADTLTVPFTTIHKKIDEIRDSMKRSALYADLAGSSPPEEFVDSCDSRPFVHQLRWIGIGERRIDIAVRDYYRSSTQRAQWVRDGDLFPGELDVYDGKLFEAWEPRYYAMKDNLDSLSGEHEKRQMGTSLYFWAENDVAIPLREITDRFLCFGSLHILANDLRVGWHADFSELAKALGSANGTA